MKHRLMAKGASLALILVTLTVSSAEAQIGRIRDAARRAAEREAEKKIVNTVRCAFDDAACIAKARNAGHDVEIVDAQGNVMAAGQQPAGAATAFVNFDFVPGERILFAEDFGREEVGNFPRRLEHVRGNMEVAEWQGARWLRATGSSSSFAIPLPEVLTEQFTMEMEVVPGRDNMNFTIRFSETAEHRITVRYFQHKINGGVGRHNGGVAVSSTEDVIAAGTPFPLRILADGSYVKVYAGGTRIANMPNADLGRGRTIWIQFGSQDRYPGFIRDIRVAAGGKRLYDALNETGRVATQGIFFDTGSDVIRPESAPTLKEIGDMLQQHAALRLTIEGHTDSVGNAAANQQLSERRAAAVRSYLEREHGIAAERLEALGLGAANPVAPNDTPEGRQQNRRVELVRRDAARPHSAGGNSRPESLLLRR
jgi:OmpA-OmpF porin, OOP family